MLVLTAVGVNAQVTTSAISGKVTDEQSETVIGATIIAVHEPSGTQYGAITNVDGRYTIQGMRTGGPYKLTVSYVGYQSAVFTGIMLELGNTYTQNVKMHPSSELLDEVVVVADAKTQSGAATNFSANAIENTPTVDRNIYDIVKNSPLAMTSKNGGITFVGSNNRYNSFQIDGTVANDVFGLSAGGTNGAQTGANPISMDAIQEIQVVVAPYDVRQSGFTGGGINAITKQGTNETHGSAYTYFNNQNMYGKYSAVRGYEKSPMSQQFDRTYGGTLGGAIIKNKLFYFVSAEGKKNSYPSSTYPGYTTNYITSTTAKLIADQYKKLTGIEETYGERDIEQKSFGLLARVDWNISEKHKLAVRYQHNNSYKDVYGANSTTYYFGNSGYRMNNKMNSVVAELNSRLGDNLYNELRASGTFVRDFRDTEYAGPCVQISNVTGGDGETKITANIGTEFSSGANKLNQDVYSFEDNLSWYLGNHTLTFGTHNEIYKISNLFIQASEGAWYYNSLDHFLQDKPYKFTYKYSDPDMTGGNLKYAPVMKAGQFGFYAQDKWIVSRDFNFTYGIRFDIPLLFNKPTVNPTFNDFAAGRNMGVRVGETPSAKLMVSPRVGFSWYTDEEHRTLIRGGVGIFTGRVPFVWLSNSFNNTGMEQKGTTLQPKDESGKNDTNEAPSLGEYKDNPLAAATGSMKQDIVTTDKKNTNKGYSYALSALLEKHFGFGLDMSASYTFGHSKSVNDGTSSVAYSNWKYNYSRDTNSGNELGFSKFDIPHRVMAQVAYTTPKYWNNWMSTSISVIYNGFSGNRYSLTMNETSDFNGDGQKGNSLLYIPTDEELDKMKFVDATNKKGEVTMTAEESRQAFKQWIEGDAYAKEHRGQYAERNSNLTKWEHEINLHLAQTIYNPKGLGKLEFTFDIINFANMLNKKWGATYGSLYNLSPISVTKLTTVDGQTTPNYIYNKSEITKSDVSSRWHAQVGIRLTF